MIAWISCYSSFGVPVIGEFQFNIQASPPKDNKLLPAGALAALSNIGVKGLGFSSSERDQATS